MRLLPFRPFDREAAWTVYYNNLPHWRQVGGTYFVTWRLADSIPKDVLAHWDHEKCVWLAFRVRAGKLVDEGGRREPSWKSLFNQLNDEEDQEAFRREFDRRLNDYLDNGAGSCHLADSELAEIVLDVAKTFDEKRYDLGDCVVMPNHVHLLITPYEGHALENVLKGIKGVSARRINERLQRQGSLWQKDSYDHLVRDLDALRHFQTYIGGNPMKAGLDLQSCVCRKMTYGPD